MHAAKRLAAAHAQGLSRIASRVAVESGATQVVKLAPFVSTPQKGEKVLAGEFNSNRHHGLIHGFQSPFHWQTQQNLSQSDWHIYGANLHGAQLFQVLCPTIPAPSSSLFNAYGRLIGKRGLGDLTKNDKTYAALMPYAIHSVLQAGLENIEHAGLKAALKQTLDESASANQSGEENVTTLENNALDSVRGRGNPTP